MKAIIDLTGQQFGKLKVIEEVPRPADFKAKVGGSFWRVRCECNKEKIVPSAYLRRGRTTHCGCVKRYYEYKDRTGQRHGRLVVIGLAYREQRPSGGTCLYWNVHCDCGNDKVMRGDALRNNHVFSCGCYCAESARSRSKSNSPIWKGCGVVPGNYFTILKTIAKKRNLEFTITIEYIADLLEQQNFKCALTGLPIGFEGQGPNASKTASLDRIDSSKGDIPGNVQWVHKEVNLCKMDLPQERFIELCCLIADIHRSKQNEG